MSEGRVVIALIRRKMTRHQTTRLVSSSCRYCFRRVWLLVHSLRRGRHEQPGRGVIAGKSEGRERKGAGGQGREGRNEEKERKRRDSRVKKAGRKKSKGGEKKRCENMVQWRGGGGGRCGREHTGKAFLELSLEAAASHPKDNACFPFGFRCRSFWAIFDV